ncbi:hypothetical protein WU83_03905 [Mycobacterium nebraskense]|nr:hypothetical protein WU83_03905 [Mycobacterium nebraskense]
MENLLWASRQGQRSWSRAVLFPCQISPVHLHSTTRETRVGLGMEVIMQAPQDVLARFITWVPDNVDVEDRGHWHVQEPMGSDWYAWKTEDVGDRPYP